VLQLAAGKDHTCALLADGNVACWGGNYAGQLAGEFAQEVYLEPVVTELPEGRVKTISTSGDFSCALHDTGRVSCWGSNTSLQLGNTYQECAAVCNAASSRQEGTSKPWDDELAWTDAGETDPLRTVQPGLFACYQRFEPVAEALGFNLYAKQRCHVGVEVPDLIRVTAADVRQGRGSGGRARRASCEGQVLGQGDTRSPHLGQRYRRDWSWWLPCRCRPWPR
jgi:hypothetical protein